MKFTPFFWIALAITLIFFVYPTFQTWNAPAADGLRIYGFPLQFYASGGFCPAPGCDHTFNILYLVIDLLLVFGVPLLINAVATRKKH